MSRRITDRCRRVAIAGVAALLAVAGCRSRYDAPPPAVSEDIEAPPPVEPSSLNVPVSYDLSPIVDDLERIIPRRIGDLEARQVLPSNRRIEFSFDARRDRFRVRLDGDTARITAVVHYRGRGWYDPPIGPTIGASCGVREGDAAPRAIIALSAPIGITEEWRLSTRSRVHRVAPLSSERRDRCRITFVSVDITDRLMDAVAKLLRDHGPEIDAAVAGVDVRSEFEKLWQTLQTPIELTDSVWLLIDPLAVRKGPVTSEGLMVTANIGLTATPRIIVGRRPDVAHRPLPPLDTGVVQEGLRVEVQGIVDYDVASSVIANELVGRTFERARHNVRITGARLYGIGGGRLALQITFTGSSRGRLYFVGTPELDPETRQVTIPDLDVELASSDVLLRSLAWLGRSPLVDFLRERARFPIEDPIVLGRKYLLEGLNRELSDDVTLSGEVIDVQPIGVHATQRALFIRASAEATARLTVREAEAPEVK